MSGNEVYHDAMQSLQRGDTLDGVRLLANSLKLGLAPEHLPDAHANLGTGLWMLQRAEESETHYASALKIRPDNSLAHFNYGILCVR